MSAAKSDADIARANGWTVGTRLQGREGFREITAVQDLPAITRGQERPA